MHGRVASARAHVVARSVRPFSSVPSAKVNDHKSKSFKPRNFKPGDTPPNPFSSSKDPEVPQVLSLVENLVRNAASPPPGWKELRTQTEDYRLHGLVKKAEKARSVSLEQQQFMNNAELSVDEDQGDVNTDFESGSLVEMRRYVGFPCFIQNLLMLSSRGGTASYGVVLSHTHRKGRLELSTMMSNGEVWKHPTDVISFIVPSFIPRDLVERCGDEQMSQDSNQLNARIEVLRRVRQVEKVIEQQLNVFSSWSFDVWGKVHSRNHNKWTKVSVKECIHLVPQFKVDLVHMLVMHRFLIERPLLFVPRENFLFTHEFDVRPPVAVTRIRTVDKWRYDTNGPLQNFIQKASELVKVNRDSLASSFRNLEAPSWSPMEHEWNDNDKLILQFLLDALKPLRSYQIDPCDLSVTYILKGLLPEQQEVGLQHLHQVLVLLGVLSPWQETVTMRSDLREIFDSEVYKKREEQSAKAIQALATPAPAPSEPLGPLDLYRQDPLDSLRIDFKLPVYVIDEATAEELDDGISFEPVSDGKYWLHIHVADPCSIIPPTHTFAHAASARLQTFYLAGRSYPMLPTSLAMHPTFGLSLGSGTKQKALTFSAKVDLEGGMYDYRIAPTILHDTRKITYNSVDAALDVPGAIYRYPFSDPADSPVVHAMSDSEKHDLRTLFAIARGFIKKRYDDEYFNVSRERAAIVDFKPPAELASPRFEPGLFTGFPDMKYRVTSSAEEDRGSRALVAEAMKVASRIASRFFADRNLPAIRRYQLPPSLASESMRQELLDLRNQEGYVLHSELLSRIVAPMFGDYTMDIRGHFALGVPDSEGYLRVTSPLRRFLDMHAHWQIYSALLNKKPTFSVDWTRRYMSQVRMTERFNSRFAGSESAFYLMQYISRWVQDGSRREGKPDPLENLTGYVEKVGSENSRYTMDMSVLLNELGIKAYVIGVKEPLQPGTQVNLRVTEMRPGARPRLIVEQK
jgi:exoribonuclease II